MLRMKQHAWLNLVKELHKHYDCNRCKDPTCCKIAAQLSKEDLQKLLLAQNMNQKEFIRRYCEVSQLGLYLKPPCSFLRTDKKQSRCILHTSRPYMCTVYPFSSYPGMLLNIDICPLSAEIAEDLKELRIEVMGPDEPKGTDDEGEAVAEVFNALDKLAPKSAMGDEKHTNIICGVGLYRLLLEKKRNETRFTI